MTSQGAVWEYNLNLVKVFIETFGRAPKYKEVVNGVKLGQFWSQAKSNAKHGNLTADRKAVVDYIVNTML